MYNSGMEKNMETTVSSRAQQDSPQENTIAYKYSGEHE